MTSAPATASHSGPVAAMSTRPTACAVAAMAMLARGPARSGSQESSSRAQTTVTANAVNTAAPWPTPTSSRCSTTKPASAA